MDGDGLAEMALADGEEQLRGRQHIMRDSIDSASRRRTAQMASADDEEQYRWRQQTMRNGADGV